jgi:glycosyltransferase involved in cell wall biosynthesis
MRILFIADRIYPHSLTGFSSYQWGLLKSISAIPETKITLLSTTHPFATFIQSFKELNELQREFLHAIKGFDKVIFQPSGRNSIWRELEFSFFRGNFLKGDYNVIHFSQTSLSSVNYCKSKNSWLIAHFAYPRLSPFKRYLIFKAYQAMRFFKKRFVIAPTSKYIAKMYMVLGSSNCIVIPPAVDTEFYRPHNINTPSFSMNTERLIMYMGPLTASRFPFKTVLRTLRILNTNLREKVSLLIVTAPWRYTEEVYAIREIWKYADKLGIRSYIRIISKILMPSEKAQLYNLCDVLLQFFIEPVDFVPVDPPITTLETMSCAKPVVVTKSFSLPIFIQDKYNGYFLKSLLDEKHLAEVLSEALTDAKSTGYNARRTILKYFSVNKVSTLIKSMYHELDKKTA